MSKPTEEIIEALEKSNEKNKKTVQTAKKDDDITQLKNQFEAFKEELKNSLIVKDEQEEEQKEPHVIKSRAGQIKIDKNKPFGTLNKTTFSLG